jgi:hypothetical protein
VTEEVRELGFDAHVYDDAGYPVDPSVHSHAACVKAVAFHDIILAFADDKQGGEFQMDLIPPNMADELRAKGILPVRSLPGVNPTVFQVEVLTARGLGKPTIVFIPKNVEAQVEQTVKLLREGGLTLRPRAGASVDPVPLIKAGAWTDLARHFDVPSGLINSFNQIAFLERLRKEQPNYVSFYDPRNFPHLAEEIKSRLSGVVFELVREHAKFVDDRIAIKRNPVGTNSLQDLLRQGLILVPPFEILSGVTADGQPLFTTSADPNGLLATELINRRNVLLLGSPGLGKTTASLLTYRNVLVSATGVHNCAPLFTSWRDLITIPNSEDAFIRTLLALPRNHEPWPSKLPLPPLHWVLVLDGLDESTQGKESLLSSIAGLCNIATILLSCRQQDFDRGFQRVKHYFHTIVRLLTWEQPHIRRYTNALRAAGKAQAADFIDRQTSDGNQPEFLSLPLWLSMLTFLAERWPADTGAERKLYVTTDYDLLRECSDAVAEDEIRRHGVVANVADLRNIWCLIAWELHRARRENREVRVAEIANLLAVKDAALEKAAFAFLETYGEHVRGFFHEVFHEYWLAEYLVDQISNEKVGSQEIAEKFSYQRTVQTNRLIRSRIKLRESISKISASLREAFFKATGLGPPAEFAKNQLVYLLGRIDESTATNNFLGLIWRSSQESQFVKYSAAFAATILGDATIENEYYTLLRTSERDDRINRGYHLYYYGDIDVEEHAVPPFDDGQNPAQVTLRQLFIRLRRKEERHRNLRRIELFTIRRFLETARTVPPEVENVISAVEGVMEEAKSHPFGAEFAAGVQSEGKRVLELIGKSNHQT